MVDLSHEVLLKGATHPEPINPPAMRRDCRVSASAIASRESNDHGTVFCVHRHRFGLGPMEAKALKYPGEEIHTHYEDVSVL